MVSSLPFEFFNYIAQVIVNPELVSEINIPLSVENFFKENNPKDSAILYNLIKDNKIAPDAKSFMESYINLFLFRYFKSFNSNTQYSLKRINTPEEYGLMQRNNIFKKDIEIFFVIDEFIPRNERNLMDFDKLVSQENTEHTLSILFSIFTSQFYLENVFINSFADMTSYPFVLSSFSYKEDVEYMITDVCFEILRFCAKSVYLSNSKVTTTKAVEENLLNYYVETIDPDNFQYPDDLNPLIEKITEIITQALDDMKNLNPKTKTEIYHEIIEIALLTLVDGLGFPEYYYLVKLREASNLDRREFQIDYALDVYLYDIQDKTSKNEYETYAITISDDIMTKVLEDAFNNEKLFDRFLKLS